MPASPPSAAETEIIAIRAADGVGNSATVYRAAHPQAPVILIWPAMGTPARFYRPLAQALAAAGLHAVTADLRGIGASTVRASRQSDFGYEEMVAQDWPAAVAAVRHAFPDSPLWLLGHSLGGQISALYAARHPGSIAGLILIASGSVHYRGWQPPHRWTLLALTQVAAGISAIAGYFPGHRLRFAGREARGVIFDWARLCRTGRFRLRGGATDDEHALSLLSLPAFALSFAGDRLAPRQSTAGLLAKMKTAQPLHRHLAQPLDHFNWVKQPQVVIPHVMEWISVRATSA